MNKRAILKNSKTELSQAYVEIRSWYEHIMPTITPPPTLASVGGKIGSKIAPITKRLKINAFMDLAKEIQPYFRNDMTITVGVALANELIGRSINKDDLMVFFSTNRTSKNKVKVGRVVKEILESPACQRWIIEYEELLDDWSDAMSTESARFRAWKDNR